MGDGAQLLVQQGDQPVQALLPAGPELAEHVSRMAHDPAMSRFLPTPRSSTGWTVGCPGRSGAALGNATHMGVVVNETMARTLWPGGEAIGGTVNMLDETSPRATVVGVVRDERLAPDSSSPRRQRCTARRHRPAVVPTTCRRGCGWWCARRDRVLGEPARVRDRAADGTRCNTGGRGAADPQRGTSNGADRGRGRAGAGARNHPVASRDVRGGECDGPGDAGERDAAAGAVALAASWVLARRASAVDPVGAME